MTLLALPLRLPATAGAGLAATYRGSTFLQSSADVLTGLALVAIAAALFRYFSGRKRPGLGWEGWLFIPLAAASALSHFITAYAIWTPTQGFDAMIKLASAVVAGGTALALWTLMPRLMASPSKAQLSTQVAQRTADLVSSNERLTQALSEVSAVQQALSQSEECYRVSFEAATVGKAQSDPKTGLLLRANKAFADMLGYEPDELVGRVGWEFTWPEDRAGDRREFDRVKSGEISAYVREKRYIRKDGSPVWGRVSANIVSFPESGQPDLAIAVVEDIDERRKTQAELDVARRDLEDVVVERTAALVERDLLIREVYHRVKNNLQVIDSLVMLQERALLDPAAKSALKSLRSRVYALGLVHHQLMGSADLRTFDVAPFLQELLRNLVEGSAARGVVLNIEAAPLDVGLDFAIPLGLLVTELVTNSLKHAFPDGTGNVDVVLTRSEDGSVALVVADDGTGYAARNEAGPSGRLGEQIIRGLVRQLHATITVDSRNGTRSEVQMAKAA